jgi:8-oxo-dGTP pyrophosphatase MutT (NUDIX family)
VLARPTGRILLLRRSGLVRNPGQWACPGGRIDAGEDPLQAAFREFSEEAGPPPPLHVIARLPARRRFHHFLALCEGEFEPRLNWESDGWGWFVPGQYPYPMHRGMHGALRALEQL